MRESKDETLISLGTVVDRAVWKSVPPTGTVTYVYPATSSTSSSMTKSTVLGGDITILVVVI